MISDKITRLQTAKTNIANAITLKGGTVSSGDGFEAFANDIATIPSGITPTGTLTITANGNYNISQYANVIVAVDVANGQLFTKDGMVFVTSNGDNFTVV